MVVGAFLYEKLLGERAAGLSAEVRALHAPGRARGVLAVRRGRGVAGWLGWACRFPRADTNAELALVVTEEEVPPGGTRFRWERRIGATTLVTTQTLEGELVLERFGPFVCVFSLLTEKGALVFRQRGARLAVGPLQIPLPGWLAPDVCGRAEPEAGAVRVAVEVRLRGVGLVLGYRGIVRASEAE